MPASLSRLRRAPGLRRTVAVLVPALLIPALAACGSSKPGYGDPTSAGFDAASVGGAFGTTPTLKWNSQLAYPASTTTQTLVQGNGPDVPADKSVDLHIYIADANTALQTAQQKCRTTASPSPSAGASSSASSKTSASPSAAPQTITPCPSNVSFPVDGDWAYQTKSGGYDSFTASSAGPVWQKILQGAKVGSRIEAISTSEDVFPPQQQGLPAGNPQLGIANHDPLLLVVDVMRISPQAPAPKDDKVHDVSPSTLPKVVEKGGKPSGFDWTGIKKPSTSDTLKRAILKQGNGPALKSSDTVTVDYLGMTYKAKAPFDESYSKKPASFPLTGVVKGWTTGLTGVKVGSRVLLQIPPAMGYGAQGQGADIPGNATLWFVIDVLKAKSGS